MIPLPLLSQFIAHKQKFFTGIRPHIDIEQPQISEMLMTISRHASHQGSLAMHHLIMGRGNIKFSVKA